MASGALPLHDEMMSLAASPASELPPMAFDSLIWEQSLLPVEVYLESRRASRKTIKRPAPIITRLQCEV